MVPGKLKTCIRCPETNSCKNCPFPECRDNQRRNLSWEEYIHTASGKALADHEFEHLEDKVFADEILRLISAKSPKCARAIELKAYYGLSVAEIAERMHDTERNIYYYINKAKEIGLWYN